MIESAGQPPEITGRFDKGMLLNKQVTNNKEYNRNNVH